MTANLAGARKARLNATAVALSLVSALAILIGIVVIGRNLVLSSTEATDFAQYYLAGKRTLEGLSIYNGLIPAAEAIGLRGLWIDSFPYPPLFALMVMPLSTLPYSWALLVWYSLSLIFFDASLLLVMLARGIEIPPYRAVLLSGLLLFLLPTFIHLSIGQVELLLLLVLVAAWRGYRQGNRWLPGALVGLATGIKLFPGALLLYFITKREFKSLVAATVTLLGFLAVTVASLGLPEHLDYVRKALPAVAPFLSSLGNHSLSGLVYSGFWLVQSSGQWPGPSPVAVCLAALLSLSALGATCWACWGGEQSRGSLDLEFSLFFIAMILVSPISFVYYQVFLIFPLLIFVGAPWHVRGRSRLAFSLVLICSFISYYLPLLPALLGLGEKVPDLFILARIFPVLAFYAWNISLLARVKRLAASG